MEKLIVMGYSIKEKKIIFIDNFITEYKKEYTIIHNNWLKACNDAIINKKINYDFIIFNEDFYFKQKITELNKPYSLSLFKPKPIISKLYTLNMIRKFLEYRYLLHASMHADCTIMDFLRKTTQLSDNDEKFIRKYMIKMANLTLANTIVRSLIPRAYFIN